MTEPKDDYVEEGGDGKDPTLPDDVPVPDEDAEPEEEPT